jgi:hypothetical protein
VRTALRTGDGAAHALAPVKLNILKAPRWVLKCAGGRTRESAAPLRMYGERLRAGAALDQMAIQGASSVICWDRKGGARCISTALVRAVH